MYRATAYAAFSTAPFSLFIFYFSSTFLSHLPCPPLSVSIYLTSIKKRNETNQQASKRASKRANEQTKKKTKPKRKIVPQKKNCPTRELSTAAVGEPSNGDDRQSVRRGLSVYRNYSTYRSIFCPSLDDLSAFPLTIHPLSYLESRDMKDTQNTEERTVTLSAEGLAAARNYTYLEKERREKE